MIGPGEDTLTMQLAIPLDLCIYNKHIYRYEMVQSNGCNWMTKKMSECQRALLSIARLYAGLTQ